MKLILADGTDALTQAFMLVDPGVRTVYVVGGSQVSREVYLDVLATMQVAAANRIADLTEAQMRGEVIQYKPTATPEYEPFPPGPSRPEPTSIPGSGVRR